MRFRLFRVFGPGALLLLLVVVLLPLPSAAQSTPTATPPAAQVTATITATVTATATATAAATIAATVTVPAATIPTATATKTAAAAPGRTTVRTSAGTRLRVRSGPGSSYPIIARLANGQSVTLLGRDSSSKWLLIAVPGQDAAFGWISADYATVSTPLAQLPVSSAVSAAPTGETAAGPSPTPATVTTALAGALPGKIAVPVFDSEQQIYNIWLVDATGANWRLVVANASAPALSADGTRLAYRHWQRDDRGIVVADSDGANALRLTDKLEDVLPSFSPDKSKIVFSTYRQGDRLHRIYYVWSDEQNRRAWEWGAGGLFGEDPDWMADGQIVYHRSGERDQLWVMNGDSSNQRAFFSRASIGAIAAAPDSSRVAFMSDSDDGNWDIYTVDLQGDNLRRLTDDAAQDGLPAWSPDGQSLAFVSDRSGQWALWVMGSDGRNQRPLAVLPGPIDGRVQFEPDYLNNGWLEEQIAWSW